MKKEMLRDKYEDFHKNACVQEKVISREDFTYHMALSFIDRYLKPDMRVLDIGCGVGTISLYAASKGNYVLGIDISEKAVKAAMESAEVLGIKNASFKAINFLEADFQQKFDFVICSEVIEHLPDDKAVLKKTFELISNDGVLFLTVPSENAPIHKIRRYLFGKDSFDEKVGHLRRYSKDSLYNLLKENNFETIEIKFMEGIVRNFLFVTSIGNKFLKFANIPAIKQTITIIDNMCIKVFGESQIMAISRKRI